MISRTKNWAVRNRKESKNSRNRGQQRKLLLEPLEDRRLLASYMWSDAAGTLSISLGTNEDLTIWEAPAGIRNFQIDSGAFFNAGLGSDVAPGDTTDWISFDVLLDDISVSVSVDNLGAGAGTNNVTFAGGTLITAALIVKANAGPTSAIDFTGAMTLAGNASLTATGAGITDSAGSVVVTGTADLQATGQDITLDAAGNDFASVNVLNANNVTLRDANSIDLGLLSVSGNLGVTAGGGITDSIFVSVAGTASFTAGGGSDIMLDSFPDFQGAIDMTTAGNATVWNSFAADLAASTVGGNLDVSTLAGDILVNGKLTVGGAVNLNSAAAIVVNQPIDPSTVTLTAAGGILINNSVTATDGINVTAGTGGAGGVNVTATGSLTTTVPGLFQTGVMISTGGVSGDVLLTGDITTADGMVSVASNAGDVTMADGSVVNAGNNIIMMMATGNPVLGFGDIQLGLLISTYTDLFLGDVAILVNAFGAVTDADAGSGMDLVSPSGGLRLMSTNGVGTLVTDPIEFRASTLDVMNQAVGDINMWTDQSVTVTSAFQTTSTGSIHLTASNAVTSPSITVVNPGVTAATGPGDVRLVAEGPLASIYLYAPVKTDKGDLYLWADHDIIAGPGVLVQAADLGAIEIYANHDNSANPGLNDDGTIQFSALSPVDISVLAGNDNTVSFWLGDCDGFIEGSISAASDVAKRGPGILRLYGTQNNYVGTTNIYDGGLLIEGALTRTLIGESPGVVHVWSSASSGDPWAGAGLLGGSGVIKNKDVNPDPRVRDVFVHAGGTLDPGSIDPNACEHKVGQLTIWGDVFFEGDSTYAVQLEGLVPGTGHDQLVALGTVSFAGDSLGVGGANLVGELRYPAPVGSRWEIVDNDDVDLIDTRFENIPELGFAVFSGRLVNVSYNDDLQETIYNDVVLTAPGRYDFNGFYGYSQLDPYYEMYQGLSPFQVKTAGNIEGWVQDATYDLPWYFERNWPVVPPYSSLDGGRLIYDGQATNTQGNPVLFEVEVLPNVEGYEVMILTGDTLWNHDREQFSVAGSGGYASPAQTVDTWGAGALENSGIVPSWGGGQANPGAGYYRWIRFTTSEIVNDGSGKSWLRIRMSDLGGVDPSAVILGMDIRPVESVGEMRVQRLDLNPDPVSADGETIDRYQGTGAPPLAMLTVTVSAGSPVRYATLTSPDQDITAFGCQIMSDALGNFTFDVQRPAALTDTSLQVENWNILVEEWTGLSRLSPRLSPPGVLTQAYRKPEAEPLRFDFGIYGSPLQTYVSGAVTKSFLQVVPQTIFNATRGYGWTSRVAGVDRKDTVSPNSSSALRRDLNYAKDATFKVNLPDGDYSVRIYHSNPKYNGTVPYIADNFAVYFEGSATAAYTIDSVAAGTTEIREWTGNVTGGALEIRFRDLGGRDGNFVVSGIDISAGALPADSPLRAAGDPQEGGAAVITVEDLRPVVAEAAAWWTAAGLTPAQTATLANVQFAVADLGGAYLGLANPATNQIRIDNDAAMIGWGIKDEGGRMKDEMSGLRTLNPEPRTLNPGIDLLTVVMHELGHLLGYEHSEDGLMAPVLSASTSRISDVASRISDLGSFIPHPSSFLLSPASRSDGVFAQLESSDEASSPLLESQQGMDMLAGATLRSSDEAAQARVPHRSPQRYERDLDEWFSELAAEEAS